MPAVIASTCPFGDYDIGTLWEEHESGCLILRPSCDCKVINFYLLNNDNEWVLFNKYSKTII